MQEWGSRVLGKGCVEQLVPVQESVLQSPEQRGIYTLKAHGLTCHTAARACSVLRSCHVPVQS